jgi:hypothetical protein
MKLEKINDIALFPFDILIMLLSAIFFGIRYVIKELNYFFKEKNKKTILHEES